jgi:hypothetical protein
MMHVRVELFGFKVEACGVRPCELEAEPHVELEDAVLFLRRLL